MTVEESLRINGYYASTTAGTSMYPLLRHRKDNIVVRPCNGRLKKYDVPLYKVGEKYVLHRIIKVLPNGYVICGDNCINKEYGITDENILGVLSEIYRAGKKINMDGVRYKTYVRLCRFSYPARVFYKKTRRLLSAVKHKLLKKDSPT